MSDVEAVGEDAGVEPLECVLVGLLQELTVEQDRGGRAVARDLFSASPWTQAGFQHVLEAGRGGDVHGEGDALRHDGLGVRRHLLEAARHFGLRLGAFTKAV